MYALKRRERGKWSIEMIMWFQWAPSFASILTTCYTVIGCTLGYAFFPWDCLSVLSCHAVSSTSQFWFLRIQLPEIDPKRCQCKSRLWLCPNLTCFFQIRCCSLEQIALVANETTSSAMFRDIVSQEVVQVDGAAQDHWIQQGGSRSSRNLALKMEASHENCWWCLTFRQILNSSYYFHGVKQTQPLLPDNRSDFQTFRFVRRSAGARFLRIGKLLCLGIVSQWPHGLSCLGH